MPPAQVVLFETGSDAISPKGDLALQSAATDFRKMIDQQRVPRIEIFAHTDGAEARIHAIDLSANRASAAKARLMTLGVPADRIFTYAFSDSRPLKVVAPGSAERENRFVSIMIMD